MNNNRRSEYWSMGFANGLTLSDTSPSNSAPSNGTRSNPATRGRSRPSFTAITAQSSSIASPSNVPSWKDTGTAIYKFGEVLSIGHVVPASAQYGGVSVDRVETTNIGPVCPKRRYAVVVAVLPTYLKVLPMYSYSKTGVRFKTDNYKVTAMSVIGENQKDDEEIKALLTPEVLIFDGSKDFNRGTHVQLTDTYTVNPKGYIKSCGFLTEESKKLLKSRYQYALEMESIVSATLQTKHFKEQVEEARKQEQGEEEKSREAEGNSKEREEETPTDANGFISSTVSTKWSTRDPITTPSTSTSNPPSWAKVLESDKTTTGTVPESVPEPQSGMTVFSRLGRGKKNAK